MDEWVTQSTNSLRVLSGDRVDGASMYIHGLKRDSAAKGFCFVCQSFAKSMRAPDEKQKIYKVHP